MEDHRFRTALETIVVLGMLPSTEPETVIATRMWACAKTVLAAAELPPHIVDQRWPSMVREYQDALEAFDAWFNAIVGQDQHEGMILGNHAHLIRALLVAAIESTEPNEEQNDK